MEHWGQATGTTQSIPAAERKATLGVEQGCCDGITGGSRIQEDTSLEISREN